MDIYRSATRICLLLLLSFVRPADAEPVPGTFPEASTRPLIAADLAGKSLDALSMMRNEVFARHGHRFKTRSLADHFASEPWYTPAVDDAGPLLSEIERKNVALIQQTEKQLKAAEHAKYEAEEQAAWARLPVEVQAFWQQLRKVLASNDPARLSALVADDFRDGLEPMLRGGRSQRVGRAGFEHDVWGYFPDNVIQLMRKNSPSFDGGVLRFYTGELPGDPISQAGRIYRFRGRDGKYKLVGVFIAAGPGDEG